MKMPFPSRLEESSLPSIFLDIIAPNSVNWSTLVRLQELLQAEEFIKKMESDNKRVHVISSNDDS